eukprot:1154422-Pelagomonas_calceolata.AAC.1
MEARPAPRGPLLTPSRLLLLLPEPVTACTTEGKKISNAFWNMPCTYVLSCEAHHPTIHLLQCTS